MSIDGLQNLPDVELAKVIGKRTRQFEKFTDTSNKGRIARAARQADDDLWRAKSERNRRNRKESSQ